MFAYPLRAAALAAAAVIGLSGCAYNGLHSGVSVGIGNGGYYDPYYGGYGYRTGYSGYGYGYDPYWGWNDGYYYPGTGYYVYDRYRRAYPWTDAQRRYWTEKRTRTLAEGFRRVATDNWEDFNNPSTSSVQRVRRTVDGPVRVDRRGDRPSRIERSEARSERGATRTQRQTERAERRSERGVERISRSNSRNRDDNRDR
jgi:hypothetical protein